MSTQPVTIVHKPDFEHLPGGYRRMVCTCGVQGEPRNRLIQGIADVNLHVLAVRRGIWQPGDVR